MSSCLAVAILVFVWAGTSSTPVAAQVGGGIGLQVRSPDAGIPNSWEAGIAVNPYTTVNLYNGNACTVIPFAAIKPKGPALSFGLIHNSAAAAAGSSAGAAPWGFELGAGWRPAYSANILRDDANNRATLVEDDGNEYVFPLSGGYYSAPPGRYDRLELLLSPLQLKLTAPDLTVRKFEPTPGAPNTYRLISIADSSANLLTVNYNVENRLHYVATAAEVSGSVSSHRFQFSYDGNGRLDNVTDVRGRVWTCEYEPASPYRLKKIHFPFGATVPQKNIEFAYDASSRIASIRDRQQTEGSTTDRWELVYSNGRVSLAKDPQVSEGSATYRLQQSLSYSHAMVEGYWRTTLTDRRGKTWQFDFDTSVNLARTADPLGLAATPKYYRTFTHDSNHNVLTATNEIGKTWTATYGVVGNMLTLIGPAIAASGGAQQVWTLGWSQYGSSNCWRLTQVTDPAGHWVQYQYNSELDLTLVTKTIEMPDGVTGSPSNSNAETQILYYEDGASLHARGKVERVIDANAVHHKFGYNNWGYLNLMKEGGIFEGILPDPIGGVEMNQTTNEAGESTNIDMGNGCYAGPSYDEEGNVNGVSCFCMMGSGNPARLGTVPGDHLGSWHQCLLSATFNRRHQILDAKRGCMPDMFVSLGGATEFETQRRYELDYDPLGRPTHTKIISDNDDTSPGTLERESFLSYLKPGNLPEPAGVSTFTRPDGQLVTATYDELGRIDTNTGGTAGDMEAKVKYDSAGRVEWVRYGFLPNGTYTRYFYDEVNRVKEIRHESIGGTLYYGIVYAWNLNNTVAGRTETDNFAGIAATTTFTYDNRDRLIREERVQTNGGSNIIVYDIVYTYDQLGNRLSKVDTANPAQIRTTNYFYDIDPANREPGFATKNNRLMRYEEYIGSDLVRTVRYVYYKTGDAAYIIVKDHYVNETLTPGDPADYAWHHGLALFYFTNGSLRLAINDKWQLVEGNFANHTAETAREFRYDGGRARYLAVDYDCNGEFSPYSDAWTLSNSPQWTEYAGVTPVGDAALTASGGGGGTTFSLGQQTRYFGFAGQQSLDAGGGVTDARYLHGDLIGSNALATNPAGSGIASTAYTAFGERIPTSAASPDVSDPSELGTRYQYAGSHGYEAGKLSVARANTNLPPVTLSHVGARWYQPGIGRFVQRDPIGLVGGTNPYLYCRNRPTNLVDPSGLDSVFGGVNDYMADWWRFWLTDDWLVNASDTDLVCVAAGTSITIVTVGYGGWVCGTAKVGCRFVQVTRWGSQIASKRFVQVGGPTLTAYFLSGKCQPSCWPGGNQFAWPTDFYTQVVPRSSLCWPAGWEFFKGFIGQRIYNP